MAQLAKKHSIEELEKIASQVRRDIVRMVHACQSGHPGGSLGCTDAIVALYGYIMDHDPQFDMEGHGEDMFFLSNGHISATLYSTLARCGYFDPKELSTFRKINSRVQGHPATEEGLPGIRVASGSLGQGISVGAGVAIAKKINNDHRHVFVLTGDGELQEGQIWEALLFAASNQLDNLIVAVDYNGQQIDGPVDKVNSLGDLNGKMKAFGFDTITVENGNDMTSVVEAFEKAKGNMGTGKPTCLLLKTEMGAGVDFMMGSHKWHGIPPNDEQLAAALSQCPETLGDY